MIEAQNEEAYSAVIDVGALAEGSCRICLYGHGIVFTEVKLSCMVQSAVPLHFAARVHRVWDPACIAVLIVGCYGQGVWGHNLCTS